MCCVPLFYKWFMSHLFKIGDFVDTKGISKWLERLMGLATKDIIWYNRSYDSIEIILSLGDFPNVPLMGIRGKVNYNPAIAQCQLGYAMKDQPKARKVEEYLYYHVIRYFIPLRKVADAQGRIQWKWKSYLGNKDCVAYPPYIQWLKEINRAYPLPYPEEALLYPLELPHPTSMPLQKFSKVQIANQELLAKVEELKREVYRVTTKKEYEYQAKMKYRLLTKKNKMIDGKTNRRLRIGEGLRLACSTVDSKKEDLIEAQRQIHKLKKRGNPCKGS